MKPFIKRSALLVQRTAEYWIADNASTTGAALAFYCAFSLAPLLVILLTIAGWVVGSTAAYGQVGGQLTSLFGSSTAYVLLNAVKKSQHVQGTAATIVSIVTLMIGATTVLAALETALEQIWESRRPKRSGIRGWIRTRILSLAFILTLGFLLLVSLTVSTALANIRTHIMTEHSALVGLVGGADVVFSLLVVASLFALIYRYMPARSLPWKTVLVGGALTAVMFDVGRAGIGFYLAHSTEASAFGAAASFVVLLLWLYYTAQIFLFGAEFTACLGGLRDEDTGAGRSAEEESTAAAAPAGQTSTLTFSPSSRSLPVANAKS